MAKIDEVEKHLAKYPLPELSNVFIRADLVVGYLFLEHEHGEYGDAVVASAPLEEFIRSSASGLRSSG